MIILYPIELVVQRGGSDTITKLYLMNRKDHWLAEKETDKVIVHFGKDSFSNPTDGEWHTYHSFNGANTFSPYLIQHFPLGAVLQFAVVEDKDGYLHFLHVV